MNGFFLLDNYVLHRALEHEGNTSDTDILAVRFPYVSEEIGNDCDENLFGNFNTNTIIGLICEVKTGGYKPNELFQIQNVYTALGRFGFVENWYSYVNDVLEKRITNLKAAKEIQVAKISFRTEKYQKGYSLYRFRACYRIYKKKNENL